MPRGRASRPQRQTRRSDDLRPEYDLRELGPGVRGKYYERAVAGPIVVELVPDSEVRTRKPRKRKATTRRGRGR